MSHDNIRVKNVTGPVNIKSRLDNVTQIVSQWQAGADPKGQELAKLFSELQESLKPAVQARPDDSERVAQMAEIVAKEVAKDTPSKGFLDISLQGLKEAAQAVADIAPGVISVAGRIAAFIAGAS